MGSIQFDNYTSSVVLFLISQGDSSQQFVLVSDDQAKPAKVARHDDGVLEETVLVKEENTGRFIIYETSK